MNTAGNDILVSYNLYKIKHFKIYFLFRLLIDDVSNIFVIGLLPFLTLTVLEIFSLLLFFCFIIYYVRLKLTIKLGTTC